MDRHTMLIGLAALTDDGDWHWTKYAPDGQVSTMQGMRITGRVSMCVECHKSAGGGDYVFANDPR